MHETILETVVNKLKENPIFRMSLGSKELFHSNFLEFLWDLNPSAFVSMINMFLKEHPLEERTDYKLKRELKNYDICIYHGTDKAPQYDLIIENKVKSIPYKEQLEGYKQEVSQDCRFLLLTLSESFPDKGNIPAWNTVSYSDLKSGIQECFNDCPSRESGYIKDYCTFLGNLVLLKGLILPRNFETALFEESVIQSLKEIRLHDLYIKLRASWFLMTLKTKLEEKKDFKGKVFVVHKYKELQGKDSGVFLNVDMNQGNGQIAAWIKDVYGNTFEVVIQGKQYRHGIAQCEETPSAKNRYERLNMLYKRIERSIAPNDFLNFNNRKGVLIEPTNAGRFQKTDIDREGKFRSYDDSYLYRYRIIREEDSIDVLMNEMIADIERVFPNIPEFI